MENFSTIDEKIEKLKSEIDSLEQLRTNVLTIHNSLVDLIGIQNEKEHTSKFHEFNRFDYFRMYRHVGIILPRGVGKTTTVISMIRDENRPTIVISPNKYCMVETTNRNVLCTHVYSKDFVFDASKDITWLILDDVSIMHPFVENILALINNPEMTVVSLQTA